MNRTPRFRLALALVTVCVLFSASMAGARTSAGPQVSPRVEAGWLDSALDRLLSFTGLRRAKPHGQQPAAPSLQRKAAEAEAGGSCIDPQGNPRPILWCY